MVTKKVNVDFDAKTAKFNQKVDKAGNRLSKFGKNSSKLSAGFSSAMGKMGLAIGGVALAMKAIQFGKESFSNFMIQEDAVMSLNAALRSQGVQASKTSKDIQDFASRMQELTVYGDEAILPVMALGMNMGIQSGKIQEATEAAIGLSAAYKLDLKMAMQLVAKAANGQASSLKKYGIIIDTALPKQEQFNQVLALGTKNFSQATAAAETTRGQMQQFANDWGDIKESVGKHVKNIVQFWYEAFGGLDIHEKKIKNALSTIKEFDKYFKNRDKINEGKSPYQQALKDQEMAYRKWRALNEAEAADYVKGYKKKSKGQWANLIDEAYNQTYETDQEVRRLKPIEDARLKKLKEEKEAAERWDKAKASQIEAFKKEQSELDRLQEKYAKQAETAEDRYNKEYEELKLLFQKRRITKEIFSMYVKMAEEKYFKDFKLKMPLPPDEPKHNNMMGPVSSTPSLQYSGFGSMSDRSYYTGLGDEKKAELAEAKKQTQKLDAILNINKQIAKNRGARAV